jgi:putative DNA-invertase from lambdoid prophage Rac
MAKSNLGAGGARVYGYTRVSTDQQRDSGIGLDEQQRKIEARCVENGWDLAHVYVDAGVSGSIPLGKRPAGGQLLATLRAGDIVIAAKMYRCFRSALDALQTVQLLKKCGVSLWLLDLGGDVTGNGIAELVATILGAIAQFERTLISERTKDAKANMRRRGVHQGGARPFGYRFGPERPADDSNRARELIEDEAEQAAIRDILDMRAKGATLFAIRARGLAITHQTVRAICDRAGVRKRHYPEAGELVEGRGRRMTAVPDYEMVNLAPAQ